MSRQTRILRIFILIFAVLIALEVIIGGVTLFINSKSVKSIELSPDFVETELEVGNNYNFSINTKPSKSKLSVKKIECIVDDPMCSFEVSKSGKATLTTGLTEGTVTLYIKYNKDLQSQQLTFNVVDKKAREAAAAEAAAAAAAAQEQQQMEEEAAAQEEESQTKYVKCHATTVRVRAENNTDCEVLGTVTAGDVFEKVEDVDDWTHIIYKGRDGYIKTEFLDEIPEEEALSVLGNPDSDDEEETTEKKEEKKQEETTTTQPAADANANANATQSREEAEAKAAADAAAAQQALLEQQAALLAQQQAAAAAAGAAGGHEYQGHVFTDSEWNYFLSKWAYTGQAEEMITHHSVGDLIGLLDYDNPAGVIRSN